MHEVLGAHSAAGGGAEKELLGEGRGRAASSELDMVIRHEKAKTHTPTTKKNV